MNAIDGVPSTPRKIQVFKVSVEHPETGEVLEDFGFGLGEINLPNWPKRAWEVREIEVPEDAELEIFGALLIDRGGTKFRFSPRELVEMFAEPGSLDRHVTTYLTEIRPIEAEMVRLGFPAWSDHTEVMAIARQSAAAREAGKARVGFGPAPSPSPSLAPRQPYIPPKANPLASLF